MMGVRGVSLWGQAFTLHFGPWPVRLSGWLPLGDRSQTDAVLPFAHWASDVADGRRTDAAVLVHIQGND